MSLVEERTDYITQVHIKEKDWQQAADPFCNCPSPPLLTKQ